MVKRLGGLPLPFRPHLAQNYWNLEIKHRLLLSLKPKLEICVSKHQLLSDIMCIQFREEFHLWYIAAKSTYEEDANLNIHAIHPRFQSGIHWDSFCPTCCLRGQLPKAAESVCWNKLQYTLANEVFDNHLKHMRNGHSEDSQFFWSNSDIEFLCKFHTPDSCLPAICDLWRALNSHPEDFRGAEKRARAFEKSFLVQQVRELIMHKFIIALTLPATVFKQEISSEFPRFPCAIAKDDIALCQIFRLESRIDLLETVDPSSLQQSQLNCKLCESSLDTHSPVRMPCCRRIVRRECIKKDVLGQNSSTDDCPICLFCLSPLLVVTPLEEFTLKVNQWSSKKLDFQPEEPWWLRVLQGNLYVVTRMRQLTDCGWCIESQDDGSTTMWKDSKMDELKRSISTKAKRLQQSISARVITPIKEFASRKEDNEIQAPNPNGFNFEGQGSCWSLIGETHGELLLKETSNYSPLDWGWLIELEDISFFFIFKYSSKSN